MTAETAAGPRPKQPLPGWLRLVLVLGLLYLFLVGVRLLEVGIKAFGEGTAERLFEGVSNPLAALFVGVLATVMVQSSSVTTSTIVGLVGAGVLPLSTAVPMIMGANIGTTITNTVVALAHLRRSEEFRRAFVGATMHDFFNLLAVAALFPLELLTGFLHRGASALAHLFVGSAVGGTFDSPIKAQVKAGAKLVERLLAALFDHPAVLAVALLLVGVGLIFATLTFITKNMKALVAVRIERTLNAALSRSGTIGILVGIVVTVAVQSSSITTSILIPLIASGVLLARNAYPITLGANIGTTVTALI
ncbi:MAG TPA: sodium dependent phosphate transporter, partial [Actinobacteria bacterium]|nr:sodium dependent phosphate transporter [Actinomycetota bacterium]